MVSLSKTSYSPVYHRWLCYNLVLYNTLPGSIIDMVSYRKLQTARHMLIFSPNDNYFLLLPSFSMPDFWYFCDKNHTLLGCCLMPLSLFVTLTCHKQKKQTLTHRSHPPSPFLMLVRHTTSAREMLNDSKDKHTNHWLVQDFIMHRHKQSHWPIPP